MRKPFLSYIATAAVFFCGTTNAQLANTVIKINTGKTYQTIENFGASDAWSAQFIGNWPDDKKNRIADWLFSLDTLANGNPKGIGLSLWRFNIGAGSAEQGSKSGIKDEWRRATEAVTTGKNDKLDAQKWFLKASKQRGVKQYIGFFNSPPVHLTNNGKAFTAQAGTSNIDAGRYNAFAAYAADAVKSISGSTGIVFNYISPVNEPQWDWSDGGQEGCPYTNEEISSLVKTFSHVFIEKKISSKILLPESGSIKYLLGQEDKPGKGDQVNAFFNPASTQYVGKLANVKKVAAAHSYFTTSPFQQAVSLRHQLRQRIDSTPGLEYWQSEYCILGDNDGDIDGRRKDTGMQAALYLAKVIHTDLAEANATAWQWWTAISAYDYKDGLIYVDKKETDGNFSDSKMLWAMGNYSRFVRPGMKRIEVNLSKEEDIPVSAFYNAEGGVVCIIINRDDKIKTLQLEDAFIKRFKKQQVYITDKNENLGRHSLLKGIINLAAQSVVTVVLR